MNEQEKKAILEFKKIKDQLRVNFFKKVLDETKYQKKFKNYIN